MCAYQPEMSAQNDWHFTLRAYQYILCLAFQAIPRETGAQFNVLHLTDIDLLTLRLLTLFLCSRFNIKRQQKLSVFSKQKRMTVEPENQDIEEDGLDKDGEAEEVSSTLSQPPELQDPTASSSASTVRK